MKSKLIGVSVFALSVWSVTGLTQDSDAVGRREKKEPNRRQGTMTLTGHSSVPSKPDLAAIKVTINLRCVEGKNDDVKEQVLLPTAAKLHDVLDKTAYRGKSAAEFIDPDPMELDESKEMQDNFVRNEDGDWENRQVPLKECIGTWQATKSLTLYTHKVEKVPTILADLKQTISENRLIKAPARRGRINNQVSITIDRPSYWTTDETLKGLQLAARKAAREHQDEQLEFIRKQLGFFGEAETGVRMSEGTPVGAIYSSYTPVDNSVQLDPQGIKAYAVSDAGSVVKGTYYVPWTFLTNDLTGR